MQSFLTQPLHKALQQCPQDTAVSFGARHFSYAEFTDRVARLAAVLQKLGMAPGDRVGMLGLNSHRYLEYFFGTWWGGGVVNPVNIRWSPKEVAYSLDDCDTRILLVDDTFKPMVPALRELSKSLHTVVYIGDGEVPEGALGYEALLSQASTVADAYRQGEDLAAVMYTGGTTGVPKGVMLSHTNLVSNVVGGLVAIPRPSRKSVAVVVAPLFHIGGATLMLEAVHSLLHMVVVPMFEELAVLQAVQDYRATELFLVPIMIKRLIDHPRFAEFDVSSLTLMIYGASPIDGTLLEQALRAFPGAGFYQAYGMTECAPVITVLSAHCHLGGPSNPRLRSAGKAIVQAEVRIVDPDDRDVVPGAVGEIIARGPMVMLGYWNKPQETATTLRGGWMHTGDSGYLDADGYLYTVDRLKDMIVTGGENVYSSEVENAIAQMPEVSMSAVIGIPNDAFGEQVHAVVVLRTGAVLTAQAVTEHCKTLIAGYKCPRSVEFREQLPLSAAGKLQKFQLREPFWQGRDRRIN